MRKLMCLVVIAAMVLSTTVLGFAAGSEEAIIGSSMGKATASFGDGSEIVPFGTTSKHELVSDRSGTAYNDDETLKLVYNIKTYKVYLKAEHSTIWRYDYTEHHWTFDAYKKVNGVWKFDVTKSGSDRVHGDPMSLLNYYIHS